MAKTYSEQLEQVQAAIEAVELRGQSFTIDGRRVDRADLAELHKRETFLRKMAARESRGGIRMRRGVPRA